MINDPMPFPGAKKNPMLLIGMPHIELKKPSYFDLAPDQTVTYSAAQKVTPTTLTAGQKLYRVYGGPAKAAGGFWAPSAPGANESEGDWRGSNAVEPHWNAGTHIVEMTVNAGQQVQTWMGEIESQPALDNTDKAIKDWWLVGGGTQYFFQFWTPAFKNGVTLKPLGGTPWADPRAVAAVTSGQMPKDTLNLDAKATDLNPQEPIEAHVVAVETLATALRAAAQSLQSQNDADDAAPLAEAANNLIATANQLLKDHGSDEEAAALRVRSQLSLGRVIDIDPAWPQAQQAIAALGSVVRSAAVISNRTG